MRNCRIEISACYDCAVSEVGVSNLIASEMLTYASPPSEDTGFYAVCIWTPATMERTANWQASVYFHIKGSSEYPYTLTVPAGIPYFVKSLQSDPLPSDRQIKVSLLSSVNDKEVIISQLLVRPLPDQAETIASSSLELGDLTNPLRIYPDM